MTYFDIYKLKHRLSLEDEDYVEFIKRIVEVIEVGREELDISESKMADFVGVAQGTYNKIVRIDSKRQPSTITMLKIIDLIGAERFASEYNSFLQEVRGE